MKKNKLIILLIVMAVVIGLFVFKTSKKSEKAIGDDFVYPQAAFLKLLDLHQVKKLPGPMDWLTHHREPGQTYQQYLDSKPIKVDKSKQFIYIMLLGDFDEARKQIVDAAAKFISLYYGLEVKFTKPLFLSDIPQTAKRIHPQTQDKQVLSTYVLEEVLIPLKPKDAYCIIAFTSSDLWPGDGWNFVFGQASIEDAVGVWSIYRNGDPNKGLKEYQLCLRRTIKTGIHEIGHIFGMHHCIYYECNLNGSNHMQESDNQPFWLCPVCLNKLYHISNINLIKRYQRLADLSKRLRMDKEAAFFKKSADTLSEFIADLVSPN